MLRFEVLLIELIQFEVLLIELIGVFPVLSMLMFNICLFLKCGYVMHLVDATTISFGTGATFHMSRGLSMSFDFYGLTISITINFAVVGGMPVARGSIPHDAS